MSATAALETKAARRLRRAAGSDAPRKPSVGVYEKTGVRPVIYDAGDRFEAWECLSEQKVLEDELERTELAYPDRVFVAVRPSRRSLELGFRTAGTIYVLRPTPTVFEDGPSLRESHRGPAQEPID